MRKLARAVLWFVALNTLAWAGGRFAGKKLSSGDAASDEFTIVTIYGGDTFSSEAPSLRGGRAVVVMGGLMLDLRDAVLDESGAHVTLEITMGGAMVRVDDAWRVTVDEEVAAAGVQLDVSPPDMLPAEAPQLHLRVIARAGGVTITSAPGSLAV